jgi:hypothetical protein
MGKDTDKQVELCLETTGNDWNTISDDKKYGRLFYRIAVEKMTPEGVGYTRHEWTAMSEQLTNDESRTKFIECLNINNF